MSLIKEIKMGLANLEQDKISLKKFARVMFYALFFLAVLVLLFGQVKSKAMAPAAIGVLFLVFSFVKPLWLKPIHTLWMGLAFFLGYFMSRILLSVLFYFVFTPIGLILKLFGKDILKQKLSPNAESYWIKRTRHNVKKEEYERLF